MGTAEVVWTCACGIRVKAVLYMTKASVTVQCSDTSCKATRILPGQITRVSVEIEPGVWRKKELDWLVYPDQQSG